MSFKVGKITKPFEESEDQEMWLGEIDFDGAWKGCTGHEGMIEVRASSFALLSYMLEEIISALNDEKNMFVARLRNPGYPLAGLKDDSL